MAIKACLLVLAFASAAMANQGYSGPLSEPLYTLQTYVTVNPNNTADRDNVETNAGLVFNNETHYEWQGYDGWYNNPSHPDWGGAGKLKTRNTDYELSIDSTLSCSLLLIVLFICADMPLERKTPVAYPDGVYEIVQEESRGNVLVIANLTQNGVTGMGSEKRTAFFTFFGMFELACIQVYIKLGCACYFITGD